MDAAWPRPVGATEVLPAGTQGVDLDRWLEVRRGGIGGSDVAAIMGGSPFATEYVLWLDKTGRLPPEPDTYLMERGRRLEPACAQWFADESGVSTRRTGTWVRDDAPWMRANPDRFTSDGGGLECKVVGEDWGEHWRAGPALHAWYQSLWCMAVTGLDHWYLAAMMDSRFAWWRFNRADYADLIDRMEHVCGGWWWDHIEDPDNPPEVDGSEATESALKRAYAEVMPCGVKRVRGLAQLAKVRAEIKADINAAEKDLRKIENEIRAAMGDALYGFDADTGEPVLAMPGYTRTTVDSEMARQDFPELIVSRSYRQMRSLSA